MRILGRRTTRSWAIGFGLLTGALIAACWAAMLSMGEQGYLDATRKILDNVIVLLVR